MSIVYIRCTSRCGCRAPSCKHFVDLKACFISIFLIVLVFIFLVVFLFSYAVVLIKGKANYDCCKGSESNISVTLQDFGSDVAKEDSWSKNIAAKTCISGNTSRVEVLLRRKLDDYACLFAKMLISSGFGQWWGTSWTCLCTGSIKSAGIQLSMLGIVFIARLCVVMQICWQSRSFQICVLSGASRKRIISATCGITRKNWGNGDILMVVKLSVLVFLNLVK